MKGLGVQGFRVYDQGFGVYLKGGDVVLVLVEQVLHFLFVHLDLHLARFRV